jgi:rhodanese-related sulfurtransferase
VVVFCKSGGRSAAAVSHLQSVGYRRVWNLRGGIDAWSEEIEPNIPRY